MEFNANKGTKLKATVGVHLEPMGIYSHKIKNLKDTDFERENYEDQDK